MSGIAGIVRFDDRPVDAIKLNAMIRTLLVRGPDISDMWHEGACGMAHTMFWTTSESLEEKIPLVDNESGLVITADARVDNRDDLINQLGINKLRAKVLTDSELILLAYIKWREDCPKKIIGDFAFAIWDKRKEKLFCARDHMGVKPFYYYTCRKFIVFASEIKALHCLDEVPRDINQNRIIDYMLFCDGAQGETFYVDVKKLPASHRITISKNALNVSKYFTFDPEYELNFKSDGDYAEAFKEILANAVREQLRSAFPVGTTLSGGLDSSSISVLARNIYQQTRGTSIHTFSAIFPDLPAEQFEKSDERKYMDAVLKQADGIIPHFVNASKHGPYDGIDATMDRYDGVVIPPNRYIEAAIYRSAQEQGVRVLLEGHDGDTTISHGCDRLRDLGHDGDLFTLASEYRLLQKRYQSKCSIKKLVVDYVIKPRLSPKVLRWVQNLRGNEQHRPLCFSMLHPDIKSQIDYDYLQHQMLGYDPLEYANARIEHARSMTWSAWEMSQEFKDIDASTCSIEARYPFWDRRLMEFCLALPANQKLNKGWTRSILRRGMQGILPDLICNRVTKSSLAPNILKKMSELNQPDIDCLLLDEQGPLSELIDIKIVSDAWRSISTDPYNNKQLGMPIHMLLVLAMWIAHHEN